MKCSFLSALFAACVIALQGCAALDPMAHRQAVFFSPYKHLNMAVDPAFPVARSPLNGRLTPLVSWKDGKAQAPLQAVTLAFASGECGQERWGSLDADAVAQANVSAMADQGLRYMVSTGGEGNVFTCSTDAGMQKFISRYASKAFVGVDFDIESTQTEDNIRALVQRMKFAQTHWPHLRFSYTLATLAASDGTGASLNATGTAVLRALKEANARDYFVNLMVMDFGPANAANCVVLAGRCDMAASAQQAVMNVHHRFGIPLAQIEVTAMVGVNDVEENVFTLQNAKDLAQFVQASGLAGLHYWSLDRDKPCAVGATAVSPECSSLNQVPELAYLQSFSQGLR